MKLSTSDRSGLQILISNYFPQSRYVAADMKLLDSLHFVHLLFSIRKINSSPRLYIKRYKVLRFCCSFCIIPALSSRLSFSVSILSYLPSNHIFLPTNERPFQLAQPPGFSARQTQLMVIILLCLRLLPGMKIFSPNS